MYASQNWPRGLRGRERRAEIQIGMKVGALIKSEKREKESDSGR